MLDFDVSLSSVGDLGLVERVGNRLGLPMENKTVKYMLGMMLSVVIREDSYCFVGKEESRLGKFLRIGEMGEGYGIREGYAIIHQYLFNQKDVDTVEWTAVGMYYSWSNNLGYDLYNKVYKKINELGSSEDIWGVVSEAMYDEVSEREKNILARMFFENLKYEGKRLL